MSNEIKEYSVESVHLDAQNPRLPLFLHGRPEGELLAWLYANGNLEELAQSFLDNGFFAHEPLIILAGRRKGSYVALEGNRRLAALKILLEEPVAGDIRFAGIVASEARRKALREIPCYLIEKRESAHDFIGFRHIGGLMPWGPEAKARYLSSEVDRLAKRKTTDPFREVGRRVGSNATGVRNSYIALNILVTARDEFGLKIDYVYRERFGVWFRCMNSEELRNYIGFGSAKDYGEVRKALDRLNKKHIADVIGDLSPGEDGSRALVADSRSVTDYGRVLANGKALSTLRRHKRLDLAIQIVRQESLPKRILDVTDSVRIIVEEVAFAEYSKDLADATEDLFRMARSARDTVRGLENNE